MRIAAGTVSKPMGTSSIFNWQFLYPIGHLTLYGLMECNKLNEMKSYLTENALYLWYRSPVIDYCEVRMKEKHFMGTMQSFECKNRWYI
jgi:hypothetical protein